MILSAMPILRVARRLLTAAIFSTVNGVFGDRNSRSSAWSFELPNLTNMNHIMYQSRMISTVSIIYITETSVISTLEDLRLLSSISEKQSEAIPNSTRTNNTEEIVDQEADEGGIYPYIKMV
jgi:hypothetical protein